LSVGRIEVLEAGQAVPIVAEALLLSSSHISWEGILLQEHSTASQQTPLRQIHNFLLAFHTGASLQQEWRNAGKFQ
jgi:hypothetical protein